MKGIGETLMKRRFLAPLAGLLILALGTRAHAQVVIIANPSVTVTSVFKA
jgi:hypothetical protein